MSEIKDGGPAFPGWEHFIADREDSKGSVRVITGQPHGGLTVRDYFAAKALQGVLAAMKSAPQTPEEMPALLDGAAMTVYAFADAMLKAREAK